jgi:hypothetical protein
MRRQRENLRTLVAILALAIGTPGCVTATEEHEVDNNTLSVVVRLSADCARARQAAKGA